MSKYGLPLNQIPKARRTPFTARPGFTLLGGDVKSAESHIVAYVTGDENYIEAHEGPWDTHTLVGKMALPGLPWPGEDPKECRAFAEKYKTRKGKCLRDALKTLQHQTNYMGTATTAAKTAKITIMEAEEFQSGYFQKFPNIPLWHQWLISFIKKHKCIVIPGYNFIRDTFERPWSPTTHRELVACIPQGLLALYTHDAMIRCWEEVCREGECHFLIHNHDQLVFEVRDDLVEQTLPQIRERMEHVLDIEDFLGQSRNMVLRSDLKTGPNWKVV